MAVAEKMKALMGDAAAEGKSIGEKKKNIAEYTAAQISRPLPKKTAPTKSDKINPKAKYGDRPGEKRPEELAALFGKKKK
jgi:hypothetical protein